MNETAQEFGLTSTRICVSHGMYHPGNYSTAADIALLAREALKFPLFTRIVNTKIYI